MKCFFHRLSRIVRLHLCLRTFIRNKAHTNKKYEDDDEPEKETKYKRKMDLWQ